MKPSECITHCFIGLQSYSTPIPHFVSYEELYST